MCLKAYSAAGSGVKFICMKILIQPTGSKTCGHHCVAMITGHSVDHVIKSIGHQRATTTKMVANLLIEYGYTCPMKLTRYKRQELPETCILKYRFAGRSTGHWVVKHGPLIYDPSIGVYPFDQAGIEASIQCKISSFLPVYTEQ